MTLFTGQSEEMKEKPSLPQVSRPCIKGDEVVEQKQLGMLHIDQDFQAR